MSVSGRTRSSSAMGITRSYTGSGTRPLRFTPVTEVGQRALARWAKVVPMSPVPSRVRRLP